MTHHDIPPPPRQDIVSNLLTGFGLMILMGGLAVGIVVSASSLDTALFTRTTAWLTPVLFIGIGAILVGVILRFSAILASLRLRLRAMQSDLPALIHNERGETR